jgi:hypothetical protein
MSIMIITRDETILAWRNICQACSCLVLCITFLELACHLLSQPAFATDSESIKAFVTKHCVACHGGDLMEADVDLRNYNDQRQLLKHRDIWFRALEQVTSKAMPPESEAQPNEEERALFMKSLTRSVKDVDWKQFHDPGRLGLSRLTTIEYRHAIRDIFGVDLQAGDFLGKDPEGNTGFTNDRDSLTFPLFAMDGFLREAERAVEGFMNCKREPWSQSIELEKAWQLNSDKSTELSDDGLYVVLKERNAPFQLNINIPFSGLFRLEILAHVFDGERERTQVPRAV